ncbi:DUF2184 domain-containing protein (plasmid) [Candidatus Trichorickettsia mobilis]|uniref:DUF2184 domain-containing protein n=1 Tax=Candidatus Trichorickettsia mobilis TaxID=1346319 RepID=A0ABZ0UZK3_9RICK|nr:major capsid family protein [Candidatus Trichorickettsia mobilis]WPY01529.1 DUF2184 domain-containing protein [Candidatus Trichorickettsia mobilis]
MKSFTMDRLPPEDKLVSRVDAGEVLFFANELARTTPKELEEIVLPLTLYNLFNQEKEADNALEHRYTMFKSSGESSVIDFANGGSKDVGSVNLGGVMYSSPIRHAAVKIEYTLFELESQAIRNTIERKRREALRSNYRRINDCLLKGDSTHGLSGLLNNKQIDAAAAVTSAGWAARTGDLIEADLFAAYNASLNNTGGSIKPDTLLMSASTYDLISTKSYATTGFSNQSVLQTFLTKANTIRQVVRCTELNGAFSGNANGFIFFNNSPEFVYQVLSHPFRILPPVTENGGLMFSSLALSGYGGLIVSQPKMFALRYGC